MKTNKFYIIVISVIFVFAIFWGCFWMIRFQNIDKQLNEINTQKEILDKQYNEIRQNYYNTFGEKL